MQKYESARAQIATLGRPELLAQHPSASLIQAQAKLNQAKAAYEAAKAQQGDAADRSSLDKAQAEFDAIDNLAKALAEVEAARPTTLIDIIKELDAAQRSFGEAERALGA